MLQNPQNIIESQYFPAISTIYLLACTPSIIEQFDHYQKRSLRNKCVISSPNGILRLTVPLKKGKHQQQKLKEVQIAYHENWPRLHLESLRSSYGKAPFFDFYYPMIENVLDKTEKYLLDLNLRTLDMVWKALSLSRSVTLSDNYSPPSQYGKDLRDLLGIRTYNSPKITIPYYEQVFIGKWGFLPNLSILDLLFCQGPESINIIQNTTFDFNSHS